MANLTFLTEATNSFVDTPSVGGFSRGTSVNSFDTLFERAESALLSKGIDVKRDINSLVSNKAYADVYKEALLEQLASEATTDEHAAVCYECVDSIWDNCMADFITESQSVAQLLPIKAIDLPILVKQHIKAAAKDIMQTEIVKSPIIKKHIERTYVVDPTTGDSWEYPRCFFDGSYTEFFAKGSGLPIETTATALPLFNYDIIENLTDGTVGHDKLSYDIKITRIYDVDNNAYPCNITVNMSDGLLVGGAVKFKVPTTSASASPTLVANTEYTDLITGSVDFRTGKVSVNACAGNVAKVSFSGTLSNENNERVVSLEYRREEKTFHIKDGFRMSVPYSIEQLEDAKALLDIDLYKKTYDNLTDIQTEVEDSNVLKFLDDEYEKYNGVSVDVLDFTSFVKNPVFDCDHSTYNTVALRSEYIERELKFAIDRAIVDLADTAKIENMTFVVYGNPRYISLLGDNVKWVVRSGDSLGGVRLNYSYGIMNSGDIKVQIVSAAKIAAKTSLGATNNSIRIIPFPLDPELMTFKHYKYTTHILTTANSGYRDPNLPGGSMTSLTALNRCTTEAIQGIQAKMTISNSTFVG